MSFYYSNVMQKIFGIDPETNEQTEIPGRARSINLRAPLLEGNVSINLKGFTDPKNENAFAVIFPIPLNAAISSISWISSVAALVNTFKIVILGKNKYNLDFTKITVLRSINKIAANSTYSANYFLGTLYEILKNIPEFEPFKNDNEVYLGLEFNKQEDQEELDGLIFMKFMYTIGSPSSMPLTEIAV